MWEVPELSPISPAHKFLGCAPVFFLSFFLSHFWVGPWASLHGGLMATRLGEIEDALLIHLNFKQCFSYQRIQMSIK